MHATITILDTAASAASRTTSALQPAGENLLLARTRGARVRGMKGWSVRVARGAVWITRDDDIRDIVVEAGQEHVFEGAGPYTLWALGESDTYLAIRPHAARADRKRVHAAPDAVFA